MKKIFVLLTLLCIEAKASKNETRDTIFSIDTVNIDDARIALYASYDKNNFMIDMGSSSLPVTLYDDRKKKILTYNQYIPNWLNVYDLNGFIDYDLHRKFID